MSTTGHYHSMTDDQLAEWHQLTTRVDQLQRDLAESRKATESVQDKLLDANANLYAAKLEASVRADTLTQQMLANRDMARRNAASVVQCLRALRFLLDAVHLPAVLKHQNEWPREVFLAMQEAEEVVKLLGVPF